MDPLRRARLHAEPTFHRDRVFSGDAVEFRLAPLVVRGRLLAAALCAGMRWRWSDNCGRRDGMIGAFTVLDEG